MCQECIRFQEKMHNEIMEDAKNTSTFITTCSHSEIIRFNVFCAECGRPMRNVVNEDENHIVIACQFCHFSIEIERIR